MNSALCQDSILHFYKLWSKRCWAGRAWLGRSSHARGSGCRLMSTNMHKSCNTNTWNTNTTGPSARYQIKSINMYMKPYLDSIIVYNIKCQGSPHISLLTETLVNLGDVPSEMCTSVSCLKQPEGLIQPSTWRRTQSSERFKNTFDGISLRLKNQNQNASTVSRSMRLTRGWSRSQTMFSFTLLITRPTNKSMPVSWGVSLFCST